MDCPWGYTGMAVAMKYGGARKRAAVPIRDATEEELMQLTKQIAMGLATPVPATGLVSPGGRANKAQGSGQRHSERR